MPPTTQASNTKISKPLPDCEWMLGDRWSGSLTLEQGIAQLRNIGYDRPLTLKCPSGVLSPELRFGSCQRAIEFLEWKQLSAV